MLNANTVNCCKTKLEREREKMMTGLISGLKSAGRRGRHGRSAAAALQVYKYESQLCTT